MAWAGFPRHHFALITARRAIAPLDYVYKCISIHCVPDIWFTVLSSKKKPYRQEDHKKPYIRFYYKEAYLGPSKKGPYSKKNHISETHISGRQCTSLLNPASSRSPNIQSVTKYAKRKWRERERAAINIPSASYRNMYRTDEKIGGMGCVV